MTPDEAQKEIREIMYSGTHALHEKFTQSHPDAITRLNELWSQTAVPDPQPPPQPPPPQPGIAPAPQASPNGPPLNLGPSESDIANERRLAEMHLVETLGPAQAGEAVRNAREVFNSLVQKTNAGDQAFLDLFVGAGLGNDPSLIVHLAGLKGKLANLGPSLDAATVSRMPEQERLGRAVAATVALLGSLDGPLVKRLEKLFADPESQSEIMNWLASKNFR
jgi:hypothetical protein